MMLRGASKRNALEQTTNKQRGVQPKRAPQHPYFGILDSKPLDL